MEWERYDRFAERTLDGFEIVEVPLEAGELCRFEDPHARVEMRDDGVEIALPRFSRSFDGVHMLDDPKILYAGTSFEIPERGVVALSVEMAAESHGGNDVDFRDGVAGFIVQDMETGLVFDLFTSGRNVWAVRERLALPGIPPEQTFTYLSHAPFLDTKVDPGRVQRYEIVFDREAGRVDWLLDGERVFEEQGLSDLPARVAFGFGLFTVHPQVDGKSISLRLQGMTGFWRNFQVGRAAA